LAAVEFRSFCRGPLRAKPLQCRAKTAKCPLNDRNVTARAPRGAGWTHGEEAP
jgi:hypothetical protein